jgi:hypothetical protein
MTYLMRAFDRENRKWDKLLSNPDKLRKALGMHLESEKMAIAPKISAKHLQVLQKDESLHASRLRNSYQGEPFRKEGAQFHPLFELSLPKEYWRDSNEENEVGPEGD